MSWGPFLDVEIFQIASTLQPSMRPYSQGLTSALELAPCSIVHAVCALRNFSRSVKYARRLRFLTERHPKPNHGWTFAPGSLYKYILDLIRWKPGEDLRDEERWVGPWSSSEKLLILQVVKAGSGRFSDYGPMNNDSLFVCNLRSLPKIFKASRIRRRPGQTRPSSYFCGRNLAADSTVVVIRRAGSPQIKTLRIRASFSANAMVTATHYPELRGPFPLLMNAYGMSPWICICVISVSTH